MNATMRSFILAALIALPFPAAASPTQHVEVDGTTWRVVMKHGGAQVSPAKLYFIKSMGDAYFQTAKRAAEQVSGCKATDTNAWRMTVYVHLDCSQATASAGDHS